MKRSLLFLALLSCLVVVPVWGRSWILTESGLQPAAFAAAVPLAPARAGDLNGDGIAETIRLEAGQVELQQAGLTLWASPPDWQVLSASLADLNRDKELELALLVWRPWQPWPVDRVLPYGGRIVDFQNSDEMSCHIILIGWRERGYVERWAGSALADPLIEFAAADLDGDGRQELAALESSYDDPAGSPARSLSIWEWNGFGFTLVDRHPGRFQKLMIFKQEAEVFLVTTY